jgi:hypothetical protein
MPLTRHIPEVGGVITIHRNVDGWRAEVSRGGHVEVAPLPAPGPAEALAALGYDANAPWALELARAAGASCR